MPIEQQILTLEQIAPLESAADKWIKGLKRTPRVNKKLIASIPALCQTVRALGERLKESERLLDQATQRMMRINVNYRQSSGLPLRLQAYCMRSEAAVGIGVLSEDEWLRDLAGIEAEKPYAELENLDHQGD